MNRAGAGRSFIGHRSPSHSRSSLALVFVLVILHRVLTLGEYAHRCLSGVNFGSWSTPSFLSTFPGVSIGRGKISSAPIKNYSTLESCIYPDQPKARRPGSVHFAVWGQPLTAEKTTHTQTTPSIPSRTRPPKSGYAHLSNLNLCTRVQYLSLYPTFSAERLDLISFFRWQIRATFPSIDSRLVF